MPEYIDRDKHPAREHYHPGTSWKHPDGTIFVVFEEGFRIGHGAFGFWIDPQGARHDGGFDHNLLDECQQLGDDNSLRIPDCDQCETPINARKVWLTAYQEAFAKTGNPEAAGKFATIAAWEFHKCFPDPNTTGKKGEHK